MKITLSFVLVCPRLSSFVIERNHIYLVLKFDSEVVTLRAALVGTPPPFGKKIEGQNMRPFFKPFVWPRLNVRSSKGLAPFVLSQRNPSNTEHSKNTMRTSINNNGQ